VRSTPLPPASVLLVGVDIVIVHELVRREIERLRTDGAPVPVGFHALREALAGAEVPPEAERLPAMAEAREVPPGWVSTGDAVRLELVPVSGRALREACRRGRLQSVKVKARWFVDPASLEECTWRHAA